jgi:hypothetical protein
MNIVRGSAPDTPRRQPPPASLRAVIKDRLDDLDNIKRDSALTRRSAYFVIFSTSAGAGILPAASPAAGATLNHNDGAAH